MNEYFFCRPDQPNGEEIKFMYLYVLTTWVHEYTLVDRFENTFSNKAKKSIVKIKRKK